MPVLNIHSRVIPLSCGEVGTLIDALASREDRLWPTARWPAIHLDRPLGVGAVGGHGPIRYTVAGYQPQRWVRFRFTRPRGFDGFHEFAVEPLDPARTRLTHLLVMRPRGLARLSWPLAYRWLHDALLEDALDSAERALTGHAGHHASWGVHVRALRRISQVAFTASRPQADKAP
jgi:hypothetical protein